jgi:transposase-like protein
VGARSHKGYFFTDSYALAGELLRARPILPCMRRRHIATIAAAGALAVGGTGVAVATNRSDEAKKREDAVLSDAAKRLDVQTSELRDALAKAQDAQLDAEVKAGRLTQEQADAIKERRAADGTVLGGPGPGGPGFGFRHRGLGGPGHGGPGDLMKAAAGAIGISQAKLFEELRDGKSLSEVAKAHGKSFDAVKAAVRAAVERHLDEEVAEGDITRAQADEMLSHLTEHLDDFGRFERPPGPRPWS